MRLSPYPILAGIVCVGLADVRPARAQDNATFVRLLFNNYLDQEPRSVDYEFWGKQLAKEDPQSFHAKFIAHDNFFRKHNHDLGSWVYGMFEGALGRHPRGDEFQHWLGRARAYGGDRYRTALEFLRQYNVTAPARERYVAPPPRYNPQPYPPDYRHDHDRDYGRDHDSTARLLDRMSRKVKQVAYLLHNDYNRGRPGEELHRDVERFATRIDRLEDRARDGASHWELRDGVADLRYRANDISSRVRHPRVSTRIQDAWYDAARDLDRLAHDLGTYR